MRGAIRSEDVTHYVYAYKNAKGEHLYAGCTLNLTARNAAHRRTAKWFPMALPIEIISTHPDLASGRDAEGAYIHQWQPKYNVRGRTDPKRTYPQRIAHYLGRPATSAALSILVRDHLIDAGLTLQQAATAIDMSSSTFREQLVHLGLKPATLGAVADLLGMDPNEILQAAAASAAA